MTEEDRAYFQRRAEAELELAQQALRPEAVSAHHRLAEAYLERITDDQPLATEHG